MSNFEETIARMKGLYTYGSELNESRNLSTHTLEYSALAADGKTYGIVKECNKYYIKAAQKGKEKIAESYEYLGGFCNKRNYEYDSYANALKQFGLKMASINEACDANVNISSLDPFRANEVLIEGTDKMKSEIARQRQIMYNVSMLMNESTDIGASRKDDVVMFDGKNPEAETGKKGDEGGKKTSANPEYKGSKTNGDNKKTAPFNHNSPKCADQLKENCENGECKCEKFGCDWGTEGMNKGKDPKQVGWNMEGQKTVNEEESDWASKGLPSTPGVGEADTDKNNAPFNKNVNEECCGENENDIVDSDAEEVAKTDDNELDTDDSSVSDDMSTDTDFDAGIEDADGADINDDADTETDDADADVIDTTALDDDEVSDDLETIADSDNEDIMSQIESLQAQLDSLKAQLDANNADVDDVEDNLGNDDELNADDEANIDLEIGDDTTDDIDMADDAEDDNFGDEVSDDEMNDDFEDDSFDDDLDECGAMGCDGNQLMESKNAKMNAIIESVVKSFLAEDELHDFGKHPGYRKKPMELPSTGEDRNQWGRDWNDESVHSEEPFGSKIGSSAPFTQIVDAVTKRVMSQLAGDAFKGDKKKE